MTGELRPPNPFTSGPIESQPRETRSLATRSSILGWSSAFFQNPSSRESIGRRPLSPPRISGYPTSPGGCPHRLAGASQPVGSGVGAADLKSTMPANPSTGLGHRCGRASRRIVRFKSAAVAVAIEGRDLRHGRGDGPRRRDRRDRHVGWRHTGELKRPPSGAGTAGGPPRSEAARRPGRSRAVRRVW